MRIAVVEDNPSERTAIAAWLSEALTACDDAETFPTSADFLASYKPHCFDAVFLDCYLEGERTGMELARTMRAARDDTPIAFVTSSPDFAVEGYEVDAAGYLIKPVSQEKLLAVLGKMLTASGGSALSASASGAASASGDAADGELSAAAPQGDNVLIIPREGNRGKPESIDLRMLRYCQADGHYCMLHLDTPNEAMRVVRVRMRFKDVTDCVQRDPRFFLSARGYVVNFDFVASVDGFDFVLRDGELVPISRQKIGEARSAFFDFVFARMREEAPVCVRPNS